MISAETAKKTKNLEILVTITYQPTDQVECCDFFFGKKDALMLAKVGKDVRGIGTIRFLFHVPTEFFPADPKLKLVLNEWLHVQVGPLQL